MNRTKNKRKGTKYSTSTCVRRCNQMSFADGGELPQVAPNQRITFSPSALKEQIPGLTREQMAEIMIQASKQGQGTVSDTIQFNSPLIQDMNQRQVPMNFTTPSSQFSIPGYNLNAPPAGKSYAPILPQQKTGGKMKACGGKMRKGCGGKMSKYSNGGMILGDRTMSN
jgi:hypothetical protein